MVPDDLSRARDHIARLFDQLRISRVVCVDDIYAPSLSRTQELVGRVGPHAAREVPGLQQLALDQEGVWQQQLLKLWDSLDQAARNDLLSALQAAASASDGGDADLGAASTLASVLPREQFVPLSRARWYEERDGFLEANSDGRTLFLFDEDLSNEGGLPTEGRGLVAHILSLRNPRFLCGLLSHTFSGEEEVATAQGIAADLAMDPSRFVLIAKTRLLGDAADFVRSIKLVGLTVECSDLKQRASQLMRDTCEAAAARVAEIGIYDLERIVFQVSNQEGVWEPDTLFRVFGVFQRDEARRLTKGDHELHDLATRIRAVSSIPTSAPLHEYSAWKVQRLELYEDGDYLNRHFTPVDLGDIFEAEGPSPRRFVLLAQQCDLMLRSNGKRYSAVNEGLLVEIERETPLLAHLLGDDRKLRLDEDQQATVRRLIERVQAGHEAVGELPYYDSTSGETWYVSLRKAHPVRLDVLDLCAFQEDGRATISLADECPAAVLPSWKQRHKELIKIARKVIPDTRPSQPQGRSTVVPAPPASYKTLFAATLDLTRKSLTYNCRRVGRVCQPRAAALLSRYANYSSRAGFEADLGRQVDTDDAD